MNHWTETTVGAVTSRSMLDEIRAHELRLLAQLEAEATIPTPPPPPAPDPVAPPVPHQVARPPLVHAGGTSYLPVEYHLPDEPRAGGAHAHGPRRPGLK